MITYSQACLDPNLFGPWFDGPSWEVWRVLDRALFGEPLNAAELAIFRELTGRDEAPTEPASEAWWCMGRRSGKDVKTASLAVYLATIGCEAYGWRKRLVRGERGVVQVLAVDRDQAKVCLGYVKAFLSVPMLRKLVKSETADGIDLTNGLAIEITTNNQRRVRGRTVVVAIFDELAHWLSEDTANPDEDVYQAVKPATATIPGAMLIGISSPHARKGLLWRKHQAHYGKPGDVLVARAPTWRMNPTVPRDGRIISDAYDTDPQWAAAEYGAEFRSDLEALLTLEAVEACIDDGVHERPALSGFRYVAFADPSGGSADSMTLGVAHKEGTCAVLDLVREIPPPFSPDAVVQEFVEAVRPYGIRVIYGDRYGGAWVQAAFTKAGLTYMASPRSKSELYLDVLPLLNSGTARLLDNKRLKNQLVSLERRISRGTGRDIIDHPSGAHDDVANAVAGALIALGFRDEYSASKVSPVVPEGKLPIRVRDAFPDPQPSKRVQIRI